MTGDRFCARGFSEFRISGGETGISASFVEIISLDFTNSIQVRASAIVTSEPTPDGLIWVSAVVSECVFVLIESRTASGR